MLHFTLSVAVVFTDPSDVILPRDCPLRMLGMTKNDNSVIARTIVTRFQQGLKPYCEEETPPAHLNAVKLNGTILTKKSVNAQLVL